MFIYTVQSGDSLFTISNQFRIPINQLRSVNGLAGEAIVPGLNLLIPLYEYTVQPGDTLTSIAKRSFVSLQQLRAVNPSINPNLLQPGMQVLIPNISNYLINTFNYYVLRSPELDSLLVSDFSPYSTYISVFEYSIDTNGNFANQLNDSSAIETAWLNRVTPLVTVTNLTQDGFSTEVVHQVLNNTTSRRRLINNIYDLVSRKGYGGVNIDFELVHENDRDLLTQFLLALKERFEPAGYLLTIAVHAKTNDNIPWLKGYDYGGIGAVVDYMFIMAYDWHHSTSGPGPVAPINEVRNTIEYAITQLPKNKIILGIPLYGYDWQLPYQPGTLATALSNQDAINLAIRYQSPIQYVEEYATPFYRYTDQQGQMHEVWFEDAKSISTKMQLVREYQLHGIGAWQLTLGFAAGPWLLRKFFTVNKV